MADLGHVPSLRLDGKPELFEVKGREKPRMFSSSRPRGMYLCSKCRCLYVPKRPEVDDLVCPQKMMQVLKERVL